MATLLVILLIGIFPFNTQAQKFKRENTVLWKVEGDDIKTSYVMGTFHMLPQKEFELKDKVKDAFQESNQIVLELDMDDPNMNTEFIKNLALPEGKTIDKLLSSDDYKILDNQLKEINGQGIAPFNGFKPLILTSLVTMNLMGENPASFEMTFIEMAKEQNKEILGLETVAEQVAVFDGISYESQLKDIIDMIQEKDKSAKEINDMLGMYKSEDINALESYMTKNMDSKEQKEVLLDTRNKNWIPKIGQLASEKSTFFGVGAGHLGGKNGVIALLKKAGYKVTPVKG